MTIVTIFERLNKGRPAPEPKQPPKEPAQLLLDFLQRWPKPTIRAKDIYQYAPRSTRPNKETAIKNAEVLARHGWLTALETHHRNRKVWKIVRKEALIHPRVVG
jgi:hypothetical protein